MKKTATTPMMNTYHKQYSLLYLSTIHIYTYIQIFCMFQDLFTVNSSVEIVWSPPTINALSTKIAKNNIHYCF